MFKKFLSYFYPITVYHKLSHISQTLEVTLYNGKTLLNTKNTNYSYGSLQTVLKKGLLTIGKSEVRKMNDILVLGVAGGSVIQTLTTDFSFTKNITGVELDAEIIEIANSYFDLDKITNFKCIIDDAEQFVSISKNSYDLIIIDIFKDTEMPEFLFEKSFIKNVKQILHKNGYILFNLMILDTSKKEKIENYLLHFDEENYAKKVIKNVERYNDLILIKKPLKFQYLNKQFENEKILRQLLLGKITKNDKPQLRVNPIQKRILNIKSIWNNDHQDDNGIEKIFRLFLSISQLFFPGIYIKYWVSKRNFEYRDIAMDAYILLKLSFPVLILKNHWQEHSILIYLMVYLLFETVLYIPTLIFASDMLSRPRSYKRSMMLLFLNYLEIVCAFAVLYTLGNNMNKPFTHWFDPIYFSVITSNSIGYGDFHPVTLFAKVLVSIQAMFFLSFLVLFLNFFSSKVKSKGYFDHESEM